MPVYEDSRYASATEILEVTLEQVTGKETDPVKYLSDDRKQWYPNDFSDNITMIPFRGATPDMVAYEVYGRADLAWVVAEFNDSVGFDMFKTFDGQEAIVLPSPETLYTTILG